MTIEEVLALLLAGGLGVVGKTVVDGFKERSAAKREDRRQKVEESKTTVESSRILIESAEKIVALQNEQINDLKCIITEQQDVFQKRLDAQAAALAAYETRLELESDLRRKADVVANDLREQVARLREELANMKAAFNLSDQAQQQLRTENTLLKEELFEMATGMAALTKQVIGAGLEPVYRLSVPVAEAS